MENINISSIPKSMRGACFHGEVWVRCPYCHSGNELMGATPEFRIDKWEVYKCEKCGKYFKDK